MVILVFSTLSYDDCNYPLEDDGKTETLNLAMKLRSCVLGSAIIEFPDFIKNIRIKLKNYNASIICPLGSYKLFQKSSFLHLFV